MKPSALTKSLGGIQDLTVFLHSPRMSTTNVLPLFWHLSSTDRSVRLDATESLISSLEEFQAKHVEAKTAANGDQMEVDPANGSAANGDMETDEDEESAGEEDEDDDESGVEVDASDDETNSRPLDPEQKELRRLDVRFEKDNSEDVRYSIKRLVRGLTSSRESSRLGFAVALTEVRFQAFLPLSCPLIHCPSALDPPRFALSHPRNLPRSESLADVKSYERARRAGRLFRTSLRNSRNYRLENSLLPGCHAIRFQELHRRAFHLGRQEELVTRERLVGSDSSAANAFGGRSNGGMEGSGN